ncbi:hypothetical protein E2C01_018182 [Portunus trituberculatus]|uniref:Uncharacterized protein n=1 Tax=Portunus trituberculatus TaxID=210409 RepID=A0A5B7DTV1_PORTR|nr:hypothetical protein [Portunus trituberculatus]
MPRQSGVLRCQGHEGGQRAAPITPPSVESCSYWTSKNDTTDTGSRLVCWYGRRDVAAAAQSKQNVPSQATLF